MNIDYSICQALGFNTSGFEEALVEYDVACSWSINFQKRLLASKYLNLPKDLNIIPAVGKFHLAAHKDDCFAMYSLNFVKGAGQQDGEILETSWALLNKACASIRAMSKAHRQEMLDDHIRDANWKKLVHMGRCDEDVPHASVTLTISQVQSISKKYKKAISAREESHNVLNELNAYVDKVKMKSWELQEQEAMSFRGNHLKIYDVVLDKGERD